MAGLLGVSASNERRSDVDCCRLADVPTLRSVRVSLLTHSLTYLLFITHLLTKITKNSLKIYI